MKLENITSTITIAWILNILSSIVYTLLFTEDIDGSKGYAVIFAVISLLMFLIIFPLIKFVLNWYKVAYIIPNKYVYLIFTGLFLLGLFGIFLYPLILLLMIIQIPEILTIHFS